MCFDKEEFEKTKKIWKQKSLFLSCAIAMACLPEYRKIVKMGWPVIPSILAELRETPDHWFFALKEITGEDSITKNSAGDLNLMTQDWLRWANDNGY